MVRNRYRDIEDVKPTIVVIALIRRQGRGRKESEVEVRHKEMSHLNERAKETSPKLEI